ncbi:MAG: helix-hairpin-helix domain-containing protein [Bacteroidota bacterium]
MVAIILLILLMLAAFFLGWLISRFLFKGDSSDSDDLLSQIAEKEVELEACRKLKEASSTAKNIEPEIPQLAPIIKPTPIHSSLVDSNKVDDLKIVEGIGPKIEELLNNAGIKTFAQLANTSVETLNNILEQAGPRYQMHNPATWPQQANLAYIGQWSQLKSLQDELNKGRLN